MQGPAYLPKESYFSINAVEQPATEVNVTLYTEIRLASLRTDADAFGSNYQYEINFPRSKFTTRVNTLGRTTIFASSNRETNEEERNHLRALPGSLLPDDSCHLSLTPWIGTLTVLAPELLQGPWEPAYPPEIAAALLKGEIEVWALAGMWVRPEHRGKGVGVGLVERALEEVRAAPRAADNDARSNGDRLVVLEVFEHNQEAINLYQKSGFKTYNELNRGTTDSASIPSTPDKDKRRWMGYRIPVS